MKSLNQVYRPKTLDEVEGQEVIISILKNILAKRSFKHAYLFSGASGCGKTTFGRIFGYAINNGKGTIIEIDAASNNGVDQVRAILEASKQRAYDSEYKIFIIDECHMISKEGWNAFLKGLEEPSQYTIYIFCTTEPNKIPATILNRVQRFNVSKISPEKIKSRLMYICQNEGFTNYEDSCDFISKICQGGMRDAITYLEQCADYSHDLSLANVKTVLGDCSFETMLRLTNALVAKDQQKMFQIIDGLYNKGIDLKNFINNYLDFIIELGKYIIVRDISLTSIPAYLEDNEDENISVKATVGDGTYGLGFFNKLAELLLDVKMNIKYDQSYKSTIEAYLLKVCMKRA